MAWQQLAIIQTTPNWVLTESVIGTVFRIKHNISGTNPQSLRSIIAQAFDELDFTAYFDIDRLTYKPEVEILEFIQPTGLLNRKLGIKRLDSLADIWTITIEVLNGMPQSISLPIALSEVEGLQDELDSKAAVSSLNIHVTDTQNPHNLSAAQIGAEVAGAGSAAATEAMQIHLFDEDPHPQYATDATVALVQNAVNTKEAAGTAANAIASHVAAADPHSQYANDSQITSLQTAVDGKEAIGVAANAIAFHEAKIDPHPQYATDTEINNLQTAINARELIGVAANLIANLTAAQIPQTLPTATTIDYEGAIAANGILSVNGLIWLLLDGATIGNPSSGASRYADAKAQTLFERLWTNPNLAILTSTGGASTRGASAIVDFGANKRLALPDARGRVIIPAGQGPGLAIRNRGGMGGSETHTLSATEIPSHAHGLSAFKFSGGGVNVVKILTDGSGEGILQQSDLAGGGQSHNNMPPFYVSSGKLILAGKA